MASTFHSTGRFTLVKIVEFPEKEKERLVIMIVDDEPAILAVFDLLPEIALDLR